VDWLLATFVLVFALDRAAKRFVFGRDGASSVRCAFAFVTVRPVRNRRPALWARGTPGAWVASLLLAFAAAVLLVASQQAPNAPLACGLGAALGGALGNLHDRLRHGAVLDFLHVGIGGWFNPADVALVAGLAVALLSHLAAAAALWTQA